MTLTSPPVPAPPIVGDEPVLMISEVVKSYGEVQALRGVDLDIAPGEVVALLGPNGSGKTTLMTIIAGLLAPDSGVLALDGEPLTQHRPRKQRIAIGYSGQRIALYPGLTVEENLRHLGALSGPQARDARIGPVVAMLQLQPLLHRRADALSGGQARRVHVALAALGSPRLVILDEPSAGVDAESRAILTAAVRTLADDGVAVLYSTHYPQEVEELDPRIAFLHHGRMVADGTLGELLVGRGVQVRVHFAGHPVIPAAWEGRAQIRGQAVLLSMDEHVVDPLRLLSDLDPQERLRVRHLSTQPPSLRQLYAELVGMEDDDAG
ncbi:ABC transporter ATP-binding protein [Serinicoccus marinus]|uniref:ABC transporter ATP-binding protein n=1 Tax=Serinicoccus marinus TaxID=247333 RepID=UPI0024931D89|nr:ABC transporter ATP-binding protein [Serinicoccus marinus]